MIRLTNKNVLERVRQVSALKLWSLHAGDALYGVPRGGVPVAYALAAYEPYLRIVDDPAEASVIVDDIVDSGATRARYKQLYPGKRFFALYDKSEFLDGEWVVFPWENDPGTVEDDSIVSTIRNRITAAGGRFFANDNISSYIEAGEVTQLQDEVERRVQHLLRGLLVDVDNDHNTQGTAHRIAKMYLNEVFKGRYTPAPKITDFPNAKGLDEMYMTGPITIRSACSHHFVPIIGRAWIGVIPGDRVIGLSKFNRLVEWIAARPQIQEELAIQVADEIEQQIQPKGLAVVIEATHMCMTWRGVREPMSARMTTNVMRGAFRDKPEARAEFMALVAKAP